MTPLPSDEVDLHDADPDWLNLFFAVGTDAWYRWSIPSKPVSHVELRWCTSWFHGDCSIQHHKLLSECQRRHLYYCSTIYYLLSKTFRSCTFVRNTVQVSIILDQRQHFRGKSFAVLFFPIPLSIDCQWFIMALKIFEIDPTLRGCEGQIWDRVNGYRRPRLHDCTLRLVQFPQLLVLKIKVGGLYMILLYVSMVYMKV